YVQTLGWGLAYVGGMVTPAMLVGGPWLAAKLAREPETVALATFALRLLPLAALVVIPFLLSRPVFEGSQQGRPSIVMATLRYVLLGPPLAWVGMAVAAGMGQPRFFGLMLGLIAATGIASAVFVAWTLRYLRSLETLQDRAAERLASSWAHS